MTRTMVPLLVLVIGALALMLATILTERNGHPYDDISNDEMLGQA